MPVDASIALGVRPAQFESPVNQMAKMYEMQNAQQSNQLNQMKMDEYKRGLTEDEAVKNAFSKLDRTSPTYEQDRYNAYALKGIEGLKAYAATKKEEAAAEEHGVGTSGKKLSNTEASIKLAKAAQSEILDYPSEAMLTSWFEDAKRKGNYNPETLDNIARFNKIVLSVPAPIDPATGEPDFTARRQAITKLQLEAKDRLGKPGQRDIGGSIQDTMVDPITGVGTVTGTTAKTPTPGEQKPTFNQGAWYYPPTAQNPQGVTVGESRADKPKPLTAKQDTDLQHNIGKDRRTALDAIASFGDVKLATQKVRDIPTSALENVAGWTGYLPSVSGASQEADTDIANLKGKVTSLGKIAASAGGAIGTMAVQEWTIIRDMIASLDEKKQTPAKFKEQMDLIDAQLAGAEERLRESYATTHQEDFVRYPNRFELPAAGAGTPPPPAAAVKLTPEQKKKYDALKAKHG
jgi:hypothetical protein